MDSMRKKMLGLTKNEDMDMICIGPHENPPSRPASGPNRPKLTASSSYFPPPTSSHLSWASPYFKPPNFSSQGKQERDLSLGPKFRVRSAELSPDEMTGPVDGFDLQYDLPTKTRRVSGSSWRDEGHDSVTENTRSNEGTPVTEKGDVKFSPPTKTRRVGSWKTERHDNVTEESTKIDERTNLQYISPSKTRRIAGSWRDENHNIVIGEIKSSEETPVTKRGDDEFFYPIEGTPLETGERQALGYRISGEFRKAEEQWEAKKRIAGEGHGEEAVNVGRKEETEEEGIKSDSGVRTPAQSDPSSAVKMVVSERLRKFEEAQLASVMSGAEKGKRKEGAHADEPQREKYHTGEKTGKDITGSGADGDCETCEALRNAFFPMMNKQVGDPEEILRLYQRGFKEGELKGYKEGFRRGAEQAERAIRKESTG